MIASELMTPDPIFAEESATVEEVMRLLFLGEVRHLPILRRGELIGIVSSHDLQGYTPVGSALSERAAALERKLEEPIHQSLSGEVFSVDTEAEVSEVIELMLEQRIGAVPVVYPGTQELAGIISYVDILRAAQELF
jgi:CBS domain-containing membrane protein